MTHLAGKFAGILARRAAARAGGGGVEALAALEGQGLKIVAETVSRAERAAPERTMELELIGARIGGPSCARSPQLLAGSGVNVEELTTNRTSAPMSGEMLFEARAHVQVPGGNRRREAARGARAHREDLMVEVNARGSGAGAARR